MVFNKNLSAAVVETETKPRVSYLGGVSIATEPCPQYHKILLLLPSQLEINFSFNNTTEQEDNN